MKGNIDFYTKEYTEAKENKDYETLRILNRENGQWYISN